MATAPETPAELEATKPLSAAEAATGLSSIGRYQIERVLGRGGMGVVVEARDPELDRQVAVKILVAPGANAVLFGEALRREAQALARVTHPNVLSVYDAGVDGAPYLVMQLVDGETLGHHISRTRPTTKQILALFQQVARGLSAIHAAGLIHRDIKPSNILVDKRGVVHVADLGLARIGELAQRSDGAAVPTTETNTIAGTPAYMAPEQFEGRALTSACDQFSFCVSLWEALTGERPFRGGSEEELAKAVRTVPPDVRIDGISRAQLRALRRGLSTDPGARFPSMDALSAALGKATARGPLLVVGGLSLAGAAAMVAALGLGAWASSPPPRAPDAGVAMPAPRTVGALELADVRRLTLTGSCNEYPSLAPDGTVYFDAVFGPDQHLMAYDDTTRETRELTQTKGWDLAPRVSPDGKRIVFLRKTADMMAAHVADLSDLAAAKKIVPGGSRPSWSPDGRFVWAGSRKGVSRYDATTLEVSRTLVPPEGAFPMATLELADGRVVLLTKTGSANADGLYLYDAASPKPRALIPASDENPMDEVLALAPDGQAVLVAKWQATNTVEIWRVPLDGAPAVAVSGAAINARKNLVVAGKRLVWSDCTEQVSLATVSLTPRGTTKFSPLAANAWVDAFPVGIPGTDDIVFLSYRTTVDEIWRMSRSGDRARAIPFGKLELDRLAVSHDGAWIVGGNDSGVFVGPIDGSAPPIKVHDDDESEQNAVFSRDGGTIFLELRDGTRDRIASMPRGGGATTWVAPVGSQAPSTSPTENFLAYLTDVPGGKTAARAIVLLDLTTNKTRRLNVPAYPYRDLRWSPDGKHLLAVRRDGQFAEIDVAASQIVRTFDVGAGQLIGVTYAGDEIIVGYSASVGDVWEGTLR